MKWDETVLFISTASVFISLQKMHLLLLNSKSFSSAGGVAGSADFAVVTITLGTEIFSASILS